MNWWLIITLPLLVIIEAWHDSLYSRILDIYHANSRLMVEDYNDIKDKRLYAKAIKTLFLIVVILGYIAPDSFYYVLYYVVVRGFFFDFLHSLFEFGKVQEFKWYLKNSIAVRIYESVKRNYSKQ